MPPWMTYAWQENNLDIREQRGGDRNNPRILEYIALSPGIRARSMADGGRNPTRILAGAMAHGGQAEVDTYTGKGMSDLDETPWCGCFVQWCLTQAGYPRRPGFSGAYSWKPKTGEVCLPRYGAVCVVKHRTGGHHVGFWVGPPSDGSSSPGARLLGGNQSNRVCVQDFANRAEVHYMWPGTRA